MPFARRRRTGSTGRYRVAHKLQRMRIVRAIWRALPGVVTSQAAFAPDPPDPRVGLQPDLPHSALGLC